MMSRREKLVEMLALDPEDVFLKYALALEINKAGETDEALDHLQKIIENHPDYVPTYFQMAQILVTEGKNQDAQKILTAGINLAQQQGDSHAAAEMNEFLNSLT